MTEHDPLRPEDFEPHRVEPEAGAASLKQTWREQPLIRLGIILLPIAFVVLLVLTVFGSSKNPDKVARVSAGSTVNAVPGGDQSDAYRQAVEQTNEQRAEAARTQGGSAVPTPSGGAATAAAPPADPLASFLAPAPAPQQQVQAPVAPVQQIDPQAASQLAQAMSSEMGTITSAVSPRSPTIIKVTDLKSFEEAIAKSQAVTQQAAAAAKQKEGPIIVPAGTVLYGQMLTTADSDVQAPFLVSILSGPFAGGRAIGTFQKTEDYLILAFGTVIKDSVEYKVSAIAVDPDTTLSGLETDTDHHYFERFVLPAAAAFVQGIGQAVANEGTSTTYSTYGVTQSTPTLNTHQQLLAGLGAGAQAVGSALQQGANRQPTIYVEGGTPIGIMFVTSVHQKIDNGTSSSTTSDATALPENVNPNILSGTTP
jgi:intracellular multiplication protein IcmE